MAARGERSVLPCGIDLAVLTAHDGIWAASCAGVSAAFTATALIAANATMEARIFVACLINVLEATVTKRALGIVR